MSESNPEWSHTLLLGIGNSGRQDDALGWAFVESIDAAGCFDGKTGLRYQLQIEDAELIGQFDQVVFVDAFQGSLPGGFTLRPCSKALSVAFSTHDLAPETVVFLCEDLYGKRPRAQLLMIEGRQFELGLGMSVAAQTNLASALGFFQTMTATMTPRWIPVEDIAP